VALVALGIFPEWQEEGVFFVRGGAKMGNVPGNVNLTSIDVGIC